MPTDLITMQDPRTQYPGPPSEVEIQPPPASQAAMSEKPELFKTTSHFDTTARHPDWLGADSEAVQSLAPQLPG